MPAIKIDARAVDRLAAALGELSRGGQRKVVRRALARVGGKGTTRIVRNLAKETGATVGRVRKTVRARIESDLRYVMVFRDPYMTLKDFRPGQRQRGISAAPWRKRRIFRGSFFGPGGHVYVRQGRGRYPIRKLWGPAIPREVIRGESDRITQEIARVELVPRILHEADFELGRIKAKHQL